MLPDITEAEEIVMQAIWGFESSPLGEIAERIEQRQWSSKTVKTLIDRLCEKGAVGIERWGRRNRYYALIERDAYAEQTIKNMADRLFDSSAHALLFFLCKRAQLTSEQADELIALLKETSNPAI